ncbi:hypothetical protein P9112_010686 [Eukaryota sp. TZLM1-RC]
MYALVNGTIVTENESFVGTLLIEGSKIASINPTSIPSSYTAIDCTDFIIFPGAIDPHVHLEYFQGPNKIRSADDFYTGSVAAALGGTTTLIDFVETSPQHNTFPSALSDRIHHASKSILPIGFHMAIAGWDIERLGRLNPNSNFEDEVVDVLNKGVCSFKLYTAYKGLCIDQKNLKNVFNSLLKLNKSCLVIVHAEDNKVFEEKVSQCRSDFNFDPAYVAMTRPDVGEADASRLVCEVYKEEVENFESRDHTTDGKILSKSTSVGLHFVHVSAEKSAKILLDFQNFNISGEACIQHLILTDDVYKDQDICTRAAGVMAPVLRGESDNQYLWHQLIQEEIISMTATDHCPFQNIQRFGHSRLPTLIFENNQLVSNPNIDPWSDERPTLKPGLGFKEALVDGVVDRFPPFFTMPGGGAGIQLRVPFIIGEGMRRGMSLSHISRIIATNAAKRFGIKGKGSIKVGNDADLFIYDPNIETKVQLTGPLGAREAVAGNVVENVDVSLYEGKKIRGYPKTVFVEGKLVVENFKYTGEANTGKFLYREIETFS